MLRRGLRIGDEAGTDGFGQIRPSGGISREFKRSRNSIFLRTCMVTPFAVVDEQHFLSSALYEDHVN